MATLDDLLIRRRRGALTTGEAHRLDNALRASREYEFALLAQDVFDRDGAPRPGDGERLRDLARAIERRLPPAPRAHRAWPIRSLVAAAALIAGVAAAASAALQHAAPTPPAAPPRPTPSLSTAAPTAPARPEPPSQPPGAASTEPAQPAPPPAPPVAAPMDPARPEPPSPPPGAASTEPAQPTPPPPPPVAAPMVPARPASPPPAATPRPLIAPPSAEPPPPLQALPAPAMAVGDDVESARTLFRRANALRRNDWPGAAALYTELIQRHPASNEAGISEVALGKWSLSQGRSGDALEWFRAYLRRAPGALTAEALFGEARALESIGSHAAARGPWRRLLDDYPASPYAHVARQRLGS